MQGNGIALCKHVTVRYGIGEVLYGIVEAWYGLVWYWSGNIHGMLWYWRDMVLYGILGKCIGDAVRSECAARPQTQRLIYAWVPPFTMIHTTPTTSFTQILHQSFTSAGGHSLQLMHLEVNVPRLELEFGGGLFPMQILIAWDFHKSKAWYVAPLVLGRMPGFVMEEWKCSQVLWFGGMVQVFWWYIYCESARERVTEGLNAVHWCHPPLWSPKHEGRI